ncbi:MAG: AAA family ATPase [Pirellulales bacterium]|nr:AAA family ATPase [Pirellulales bacterium]
MKSPPSAVDGNTQSESVANATSQPPVGTSPFAQTNAPPVSQPGVNPPVVAHSPAPADPKPAGTPKLSLDSVGAAHESPTRELVERVMTELRKLYVGQDELVLGTLVALFSSGHVLIESFPGLGKTLFVRSLGKILGCDFGRIQFTADLMPSDVTGSPIFDMKTQEFRFRPGPVFTQLLLADEINRSPAKTHAALLEIMQEYHVTVDGITHEISRPFLVLATQNPIESEGTYNLPEAQLDRFMFKLVAGYPSAVEEMNILKMHGGQEEVDDRLEDEVETVTSPEEITQITQDNGNVTVDERLIDYINTVVRRTREWPQFHMGASPRAGIALMQGARTLASFRGRDYAVPDDIVELALPALRHRVMLTAEAEVEGRTADDLLTELIRTVEVPRL